MQALHVLEPKRTNLERTVSRQETGRNQMPPAQLSGWTMPSWMKCPRKNPRAVKTRTNINFA